MLCKQRSSHAVKCECARHSACELVALLLKQHKHPASGRPFLALFTFETHARALLAQHTDKIL